MLKKIWESIGSVRIVIPLLIVLTLVSLIGVLIPQDLPASQYYRSLGQMRGSLVLYLGFNHLFSTWWFYSLLGLLALNVVACSTSHQVPSLRKAGTLRFLQGAQNLKALKFHSEFTASGDVQTVAARLRAYWQRRFFFCGSTQQGNGQEVAVRSPGIKEIGSLIFHFSILFFFAGGMVGALRGYSDFMELTKGEVAAIPGQSFLVRGDWFKVAKNEQGQIADYQSKLSLLNPDSSLIVDKIIEVNHPLSYQGVVFYQSSYGEAPDGFEKANLQVFGPGLDPAGTLISLGQDTIMRLPGDSLALTVPRFVCDFTIDMTTKEVSSRSQKPNNPAIKAILFRGADTLYNNWAFANYPDAHQNANQGYRIVFLDYTPAFYTGIKIARNPGTPLIWLGFIFMTLGILMVFYFPHKSYWFLIEPATQGSVRITAAAASSRAANLFETEFTRTCAALQRLFKEGKKL